jgi:cystathionine beta-synthase
LAAEIPNAWKPNQYDNLSNSKAHYEQTGPEIYAQTEGKITHLVVGVGTGGTISGTAKYLKEQNPSIQIIGIDTYGSVFKKYKETGIFDKNEIYPYITEGIGEDFLPQNVDFSLIDHFEKVTDKDAAIMTRRIPREEGIFAGNSAGSAMAGLMQIKHLFKPTDVVVVIFHDHGTRYLGKMFNEDWMRDRGFIPAKTSTMAMDLIQNHKHQPLITINQNEKCQMAFDKMQKFGISQLPVVNDQSQFTGSIDDSQFYKQLFLTKDLMNEPVSSIMQTALPIVNFNDTIERVSAVINENNQACLMMDMGGNWHIITKQDIIKSISTH